MPPRAVGCDLVGPFKQLGVDAIPHDQAVNTVLARATAFVTGNAQNGELADDAAECDGAIAGHHNHPSAFHLRRRQFDV
jgi:hypothetical protein